MSDWGGITWGGAPWGGVYAISSETHPTVSVGGVDRPYLMVGSSITKPKRGRATAQFTLFDISQSYRPVIGSPVVLTDGSTTFVGLIVKIREQRMDPETGVLDYVKYACECSDYGAIFDRRFVWARYPAGSIAKNIILDIFRSKLLEDGFTSTHVDGFTTIADELVFDGRSVTECFNQISDLTGEDWWLSGTSGKDLYFKALAEAPFAPFPITDTSANWRRLEVSYDSRSYRNREYLRAGATLQSGTRTETFTADGIQWLFPTDFVLTAAPVVLVNGIPQTVYEMNVDPYPASGWFWTRGGGGVQQGTQTPPTVGATVVVQYGSYDSSVVMAEDTAAQAARVAVEGGSGVWESIDEARDVDNLTTAQALAAGILTRHLDMPIEIQYETDDPGLEPGMAQSVTLTANGIDTNTSPASYYYVTQVASTDVGSPFPGTTYFYRHKVTLSSARDQGNWLTWWLNFYRQAKAFSPNVAVSDGFQLYDGTVI